jgi:hypothetical protein
MRLSDVLSTDQYQLLLDESYLCNGNWIPAVDGKVIPGVISVTDGPPDIQLASLKTDARKGPDARMSFYPDNDYELSMLVPTIQQSVMAAVLGRGATILDRAAANLNNVVGVIGIPTSVDHAIFGIAKLQGTTGDWEFDIDRLPHADFPMLNAHPGSVVVPGTHYDYAVSIYNPTTDACSMCTEAPISGAITVGNRYTGALNISSMVLGAGQVFQYDPATSGVVTIGGETVTVDPLLVDPDLRDGDWCVIYGVAYEYSQLSRDGDWQITQPLTKPTRNVIDLYLSLSDVVDFRQWERRRFYYCEQVNLPPSSTSGATSDPATREYRWIVKQHSQRLYPNGKYYDTQILVDDV